MPARRRARQAVWWCVFNPAPANDLRGVGPVGESDDPAVVAPPGREARPVALVDEPRHVLGDRPSLVPVVTLDKGGRAPECLLV